MRGSPGKLGDGSKCSENTFTICRFSPWLARERRAIDNLSHSVEGSCMDWLREVDCSVICLFNGRRELRNKVLNMFFDYRRERADVGSGESNTNNFATTVTMFGVGTSREDI